MSVEIEQIGACTLYRGDCREVLSVREPVDVVVSDPPYPNRAGYFTEGLDAARTLCQALACQHWLLFWSQVSIPPVPRTLVARHVWYRTNSNRPDNYEAIYEFHRDGRQRSSRVFPYCVITPGLTGIHASGHPTEKHVGLMGELVNQSTGTVLDPFMGSGTTGVACVQLGRSFVGIEIEERYFQIACQRIEEAYKQLTLFPPVAQQQAKQEALW